MVTGMIEQIKSAIITVPDFPKKGIQFKDITPVLESPSLSKIMSMEMRELVRESWKNKLHNKIVCIEARGFIFGTIIALWQELPLVLARKLGKLPRPTLYYPYLNEYKPDVIGIQRDSIKKGDKVLVVDDVLATGNTAKSVGALVKDLGGEVAGYLFFIELTELKGREKLDGKVESLIKF